jgi:leucyl/phenylalanyl-tRNA--protein transferase
METLIQFPDPNLADEQGVVAVGGELSPQFLISAYLQGIFPWFNEDQPILWWSPNPRLVLFPEDFKISHSLKQLINSCKYSIQVDTRFEDVIENCAEIKRRGQDGTWINSKMKDAYIHLHRLGYAHSFETYMDSELIGGLYGVSLGHAFFGESMFSIGRDASKFALHHLVRWCSSHQFDFIDAQQPTNHLKSLGAVELPRTKFLEILQNSLDYRTIQGPWAI